MTSGPVEAALAPLSHTDARRLPVAPRARFSPFRRVVLLLAGAAICASVFVLGALLLHPSAGIFVDSAYDRIVRDRLRAASTFNEQALARYQSSLNEVLARHQPSLDAMTREAASIATDSRTLYPMLGYLARDQIWKTGRTEEWLHSRIGQTTVDPVLQDFLDDLTAEADRLQNELDKETASLAHDLAAKGAEVSPQSLRAEAHTKFTTLFAKPATEAGLKTTAPVLVFAVLDAPAIARIGARLFSGQVARLVTIPAIAAMDGPFPFGDIVAVLLAGWSAWEIHKLDAQFAKEVSDSLRQHLDQFRAAALKYSQAFGAGRVEAATVQQAAIAEGAAGYSLSKVMP